VAKCKARIKCPGRRFDSLGYFHYEWVDYNLEVKDIKKLSAGMVSPSEHFPSHRLLKFMLSILYKSTPYMTQYHGSSY
jgi:hypothetical protein